MKAGSIIIILLALALCATAILYILSAGGGQTCFNKNFRQDLNALAVSADGKFLGALTDDGEVCVFDRDLSEVASIQAGNERTMIWGGTEFAFEAPGSDNNVSALSDDGALIAVAAEGPDGNELIIIYARSSEEIPERSISIDLGQKTGTMERRISEIRFSPDKRLLALGGYSSAGACPSSATLCTVGIVAVVDLAEGSTIFYDEGHNAVSNSGHVAWLDKAVLAYSTHGIIDRAEDISIAPLGR